jgi:hypothetical protein
MSSIRSYLLVCLVVLAGAAAPLRAEDASPVTTANLIASERFWPYQVALTRPWQPAGRAQPLRSGSDGVLIRIEASGLARVDFGRDGLYAVPVAETDLLERANRIRRGEAQKDAPNFVFAIGPRLLDSASPELQPFSLQAVAGYQRFLCVFADPKAPDFEAMTQALAPLRERQGLLTIVFPQGSHPDAEVYERLRSLAWRVPFLHDHLAEAYTATLLPEKTAFPALLLQTDEGRVLFQGPWSRDSAALHAALNRN